MLFVVIVVIGLRKKLIILYIYINLIGNVVELLEDKVIGCNYRKLFIV